jgi:hypothetical protein
MKYFYFTCGTVISISNFLLESDTMAILGLICFATYSILSKIEKK